jgi:hypothetical protein
VHSKDLAWAHHGGPKGTIGPMPDTRVKVGLSEELLAKVDQERGDIPRERWLRRLVEERFEPSTTALPTSSKTAKAGPHAPAGQHEFKPQPVTFRCAVCGVIKGRHP